MYTLYIHPITPHPYAYIYRSELWEEGVVETTFWRVLKTSINKHTYPKTNAPYTGMCYMRMCYYCIYV